MFSKKVSLYYFNQTFHTLFKSPNKCNNYSNINIIILYEVNEISLFAIMLLHI